MTGTIKGYEVIENRNSSQKQLMLQVEISGPDDIQTVEWYNSGGVQSIPVKESKVQILQNGKGWKVAVSANDGIDFDDTLKEGDKKIYGGAVDSFIIMRADGTIEINGNADFAVAFNDLKIEFEKLQNAWDTFATAYTPGSPSTLGTPPTASTSGSNIDNAKVAGVKLP